MIGSGTVPLIINSSKFLTMKLKLYKPKNHFALRSFLWSLLLIPGSVIVAQDNPDTTAQATDEPVVKKNKASKEYLPECMDNR